jgi:hypothetical protein
MNSVSEIFFACRRGLRIYSRYKISGVIFCTGNSSFIINLRHLTEETFMEKGNKEGNNICCDHDGFFHIFQPAVVTSSGKSGNHSHPAITI